MTTRARLVRRAGAALALAAATCLPAVDAREAGAKGRAMQTSDKASPFVFTLTSRGGPEKPGGLRERDSLLRVDFTAGVATYEQHRSAADMAGEPIGTFRMPLPTERRRGLLAAVDSDAFRGLGPTSGGSFSSSTLSYAFERGGKKTVKELSSGDLAQIQRIEALEDQLNALVAELFQHPLAAVRAEIRHVAQGGDELFQISVANIGTAPVVVANPRRLGAAGGVRVAVAEPEVPGVTPPEPAWTTLPLEPLAAGKVEPPDVKLAPGERAFARSVAWRRAGPKGAAYYAQSFLESYAGPPEVSGVYRARGAIVSEVIEIAAR